MRTVISDRENASRE